MSDVRPLFTFLPPPPAGLRNRLQFYGSRYGTIHAMARFAGTKIPGLWQWVGPFVSRRYRRDWVRAAGPKFLNLGGGGNIIQGALTVDVDPRADSYVDVLKRLPFADGSIDLILLEEMIEHVDKPSGLALLHECRRILAPGGTIRIATPDLDWLGTSVAQGAIPCDLVNSTFYGHGHAYIYSRTELLKALDLAGFVKGRHSTYKDPGSVLGYLDSHADRFDHDPLLSQYVEAERP